MSLELNVIPTMGPRVEDQVDGQAPGGMWEGSGPLRVVPAHQPLTLALTLSFRPKVNIWAQN